MSNTRTETTRHIRENLKQRSGKTWSVSGGTGTAYGWLTIHAPPKRRVGYGYMTDEDRAELAALLGLSSVHQQGVSIPASSDYHHEYRERSEGKTPSVTGQPYWD